MAIDSVERLLRPTSIAIVGISEREDAMANRSARALDMAAYSAVHYVSRSAKALNGRACVADIADLPDGIDVAVLAIPAAQTLAALEQCVAKGIRAAVVFAAGFAETGPEGARQQQRMAEIATGSGMAILGPNTVGLANEIDGVPLTFNAIRNPILEGRPYVAILAQSGAMMGATRLALQARGLNTSFAISTGNEAVTGIEHFLPFAVADQATRCIAVFAEQIRNPRAFLAACELARAAGKPVVMLHPGASQGARDSAASHTGALSGDHAVMRTMVRSKGVLLVDTFEEFLDVAELLTLYPAPAPGWPALATESGAVKGLSLDVAEAIGLQFAALSAETNEQLESRLPAFAFISNPLDMTAQGLADITLYGDIARIMGEAEGVGSVLMAIMPSSPEMGLRKVKSALEGLAGIAVPKVMVVLGDAPIAPSLVDLLIAHNVPFHRTPERALRALNHVSRYATVRLEQSAQPRSADPVANPALAFGAMTETASKALISRYGLATPRSALVLNADAAVTAARSVGYPVVLKVQSSQIPHKTEAGGVAVGIADDAALRAALLTMHANVQAAAPDARIDGYLVEAMALKGIELVIGARRDPDWGVVLLLGLGGIWIEVLADVRLLPLDATRQAIIEELGKLKAAAILQGARGQAPVALDLIADAVLAVAKMMRDYPDIVEVDINPLVAYPAPAPPVALDCLIVWSERAA